MRIWFDILTPKQVVFFEPMVKRLRRKHTVLCTSRNYDQATSLARLRRFELEIIGRHGGADRAKKLQASAERVHKLASHIAAFSPDATVSCCSPEAARVSFGLGIRHYAFTDAPHATAAMRLTVPLLHKVLIPWVIPKHELTKFGISPDNVIQYMAIDGAQTGARRVITKGTIPKVKGKKTILVRPIEEEAAYVSSGATQELPIIRALSKIDNAHVIVLARYVPQLRRLRAKVPRGVKVIAMNFDGKYLLDNADLFVGSGGTMTSESALHGIPTISMNSVPNYYERYVVRSKLAVRVTGHNDMARVAKRLLASDLTVHQKRARRIRSMMVDPYDILVGAMQA